MISVYSANKNNERSSQLAQRLGIAMCSEAKPPEGTFLEYRDQGLTLFSSENIKAGVCVDFVKHYLTMKKTQGLSRSTLLGKATGAKVDESRRLVDATAGLGRDSLVFAALGFHVQAFERSAVVFELLRDGLERAVSTEVDSFFAEAVERLEVIPQACEETLRSDLNFDVVYLDPMYPEKKKKALPKKEMQLLQKVAAPTENLDELIRWARSRALSRVVVKRPPYAEALAESSMSFTSKSVRYDCFVNNNY